VDESSLIQKRILLVDRDEAFATVLKSVLGEGYVLTHIADFAEVLPALEQDETDVILLNWDANPNSSPGKGSPADLLHAISSRASAPPVIAFGWDTRRSTALEIARLGATDFFPQPLDVLELKFALDRAYRRVLLVRDLAAAKRLIPSTHIEGLLGNSKAMQRIYEVIRKVAAVSTNVLINGESGTGKELVARAIHKLSSRADEPFVAFSPCALPDSLIEDELFGHEKGAFTGAQQSRRGRFEEANGGTIFLDEIGDLALPLQSKLLRVLQERSLQRLGSNKTIPVDVRLICATHRDLEKMMQEGTFRQDLYFRISVVRINLPPLRERSGDIALLAEYFLQEFARAHKKRVHSLTPGFLNALASYSWPGNVRELQNVIERSLVLCDGEALGVEDLPTEIRRLAVNSELLGGSFHEAVRSFKRELIRAALKLHGGNRLKAAQELQISRCYLHRLLNQLGVEEGVDEEVEVEEESALAEEPAVIHRVQ
jgi:DNA-binding NtrC family response regulator